MIFSAGNTGNLRESFDIKDTGYMTKDIIITIIGRQTIEQETNETKVVADAVYYNKNGHHYVLYDELPDSGPHTVHNRLKFDEHTLEMSKKGGLTARLFFETGERHRSEYGTPVGPMQMETVTGKYTLVESEDRIEVFLQYRIHMNGCEVSEHALEIRIVPNEKAE